MKRDITVGRSHRRSWAAAIGMLGLLGCGLIFAFRPVNCSIDVNEQLSFEVPESYARVRTILVRKDATRAILEHKGMRLLNEKMREVKLDASRDNRPLLNAVLGNSQTDLEAEKLITVQVTDPYASTDRLDLVQQAQVTPERMQVDTRSTGRRGNITYYETQLQATPDGTQTSMRVSVAMGLQIEVPWLFSWRAPVDAKRSAQQQLEGQRDALLALVERNADEPIILPQMNTRNDADISAEPSLAN